MTTSILNQKQQTVIQPDEELMFDRQGFDRRNIRLDFAPQRAIEPGTKFIEQGDAVFMHPESDTPTAPTSVGEVFGNVDMVRVVGGTQEIPRYTHGFHVDVEDEEVDMAAERMAEMRDGIMELFTIEADLAFLTGLNDEAGNTIFKGVFTWLEDNMPSENVINCNNFDPSSGDLNGIPANIVKQEAYSKVTGEYVETQWDLAVAKHPVWAEFNQLGDFSGASVESHWEMVQASDDDADVGINRRILLPNKTGLRGPPGGGDLRFDVTFPTRTNSSFDSDLSDLTDFTDDDDVMYLIPNHGGDFYELHEQPSPDVREVDKEGWKRRIEYKWRAGVVQGQTHKRDSNIAQDAIKLENVTALFDNA